MKKAFLYILTILTLASCEKAIEKAKEDAVIDAMTNGQWIVQEYLKGATSVKSSFAPYLFQFKKNETVDAINNGSVERTGTWQANSNAMTITSQFSNTGEPLSLLNGTWTIKSTTWTSVDAERTEGSELRKLKLIKQ